MFSLLFIFSLSLMFSLRSVYSSCFVQPIPPLPFILSSFSILLSPVPSLPSHFFISYPFSLLAHYPLLLLRLLRIFCLAWQSLFFSHATCPLPSISSCRAFIQGICGFMYNSLRPVIVHINHLETLTDICTIIKVYRNSLFHCKNVFVHRKSMKIIFTNIIIQRKFYKWIRSAWKSAQKLFYAKIFARKFTRQKSKLWYMYSSPPLLCGRN